MFVIIPDVLKSIPDIEQKVFGNDVEIMVADKNHADQISDKDWGRCDAVLAWDQLQYDASLLEKMKNLRLLFVLVLGTIILIVPMQMS